MSRIYISWSCVVDIKQRKFDTKFLIFKTLTCLVKLDTPSLLSWPTSNWRLRLRIISDLNTLHFLFPFIVMEFWDHRLVNCSPNVTWNPNLSDCPCSAWAEFITRSVWSELGLGGFAEAKQSKWKWTPVFIGVFSNK